MAEKQRHHDCFHHGTEPSTIAGILGRVAILPEWHKPIFRCRPGCPAAVSTFGGVWQREELSRRVERRCQPSVFMTGLEDR